MTFQWAVNGCSVGVRSFDKFIHKTDRQGLGEGTDRVTTKEETADNKRAVIWLKCIVVD